MKKNFIKRLCLGTAQFGLDYGIANKRGKIPKDEVFKILEYAANAGIDMLDTACLYGDSERLIGEFIRETDKSFKIVSKTPHFYRDVGKVRDSSSETLKRLGQSSIYGYLVHNFEDIRLPGISLWSGMESLKEAGMTKKIGASLSLMEELKYLIDSEIGIDIIQVPYNILDQRFKDHFLYLKERGIEIHARSVFLQGLFFERKNRIGRDLNEAMGYLDKVDRISKEYNIPQNALCLCFAMLNDSIDKVVIGVDSLKQLKDNIDSLDYLDDVRKIYGELESDSFRLDDEEIVCPVNWKKRLKAGVIIQARMGATRLPGKVLLKILDKTILEHVLERVKRSESIDDVIVATTTKDEDKEIVSLMEKKGVKVFRGSEEDVLDRFYQAAKAYDIRHIVRITADSPLIDPWIIDAVVNRYFNSGADYCSNVWERTYPDGQDVEVFSFNTLKRAWENARLQSEREHVTPYVMNNKDDFEVFHFKQDKNLSEKRWSLDRHEDFEFMKAVLEALYPKKPDFHMEDIIRFLELNPDVEEINKGYLVNEGYLKSLKEDKIVDIKRGEES